MLAFKRFLRVPTSHIIRPVVGLRHYSVKKDLLFAKTHEWIKLDGNIGTVGITDHAADSLGEITHVDLSMASVGMEVKPEDVIAVVESIKTVSDIYSPVTGKIVEINEALNDDANAIFINESSFDKGWLVKIELADPNELKELMNHEQYEEFAANE